MDINAYDMESQEVYGVEIEMENKIVYDPKKPFKLFSREKPPEETNIITDI